MRAERKGTSSYRDSFKEIRANQPLVVMPLADPPSPFLLPLAGFAGHAGLRSPRARVGQQN